MSDQEVTKKEMVEWLTGEMIDLGHAAGMCEPGKEDEEERGYRRQQAVIQAILALIENAPDAPPEEGDKPDNHQTACDTCHSLELPPNRENIRRILCILGQKPTPPSEVSRPTSDAPPEAGVDVE